MCKSLRDISSRLAELGWLHNKVRKYTDSRSLDRAFGLVGQVRMTSRFWKISHFSPHHIFLTSFYALLKLNPELEISTVKVFHPTSGMFYWNLSNVMRVCHEKVFHSKSLHINKKLGLNKSLEVFEFVFKMQVLIIFHFCDNPLKW